MARARRGRGLEAWPGYVDVLSTLLMVIVFVLMIFVIGQLFLSQALSGRDAAISSLNQQVAELARVLALEKTTAANAREETSRLRATLRSTSEARDKAAADLDAANDRLSAVQEKLSEAEKGKAELSQAAKNQVDLLNQQINALRQQLSDIAAQLDLAQKKEQASQVQIADLGKKLNAALANKVAELARYRSEFFGRLREVLGNRPDIQVVGDRFVFQSEVLFDSGSAELGNRGKEQLDQLATTLILLINEIPRDVNWVLRVDGHTDARPIATPLFASNWELSTARAVAVVKYLVFRGLPPEHLAAAGFAEYVPLDPAGTEAAYRKNRRIELRLDQR
ncbi:MAG TPA: peptidoglycan -binding protein [Dongiaceae bacterium]|nr:peptidoglycan -binding protein [Dongiaceae bacterium]